MKGRSWFVEAVLYGLLILIGAVFSLPLIYMMLISVKVDREFMEVGRVFPAIPNPSAYSPFLADEIADAEEMWRDRWLRELEEVHGAAIPRDLALAVAAEAAELNRGAEITSREQVEFVLDRAWRRQVRELLVAQPVLRSRDRQTFLYESEGWVIAGDGPEARVAPPYREMADRVLVEYDFREGGDAFALRMRLQMNEEDTGSIDEIVLPVHADDSWHRTYITLETEEGVWRSPAPFYLLLSSGGWSDLTWRKPDFTGSRFAFEYFKPMRPSGMPRSDLQPGEVILTLEVEKSSRLRAIWGKAARNYEMVFAAMPFARYLVNSFILVILNIIAALISCSLAGYAFARLRWRGRQVYFIIMLATMAIPPQVTMVPTFIIMRHLGFYNTYLPLVLPSMIAVPFFVFLLRQFLMNVPRDLEDAAVMDGCSHFRIYWNVMLPLIRPTLVIVALFSFIFAWNDFLGPLIYLSDQNLYPVSLGIFAFQSYATEIGLGSPAIMMAASTLMVVPVILVFFFAQRYFVQGIKMTGLK